MSEMENLENYKNRIKAIEELANKMEKGTLTIEELSNLETLTRELHERSIILKYKAFENKVNPVQESPINTEDEVDFIEDSVEEETVFESEAEESEPTIDFSIFDTPAQEEIIEETPVFEVEEPIKEAPVTAFVNASIEEDKAVIEPVNNNNQSSSTSFWEQLNIKDNSLSTQFEGAKIDTLIGAFGLNEKLRFINDLFDGSSESFSEAIKILDSQSNIEEAKARSTELANQHNWDAEEESVLDFLMMVNRRYA